MLISGLVSVSFRTLSCDEIIALAKQNGLSAIEWGADVHVPAGDGIRAQEVYAKTAAAGLTVAAYGSYYKLGQFPQRERQAKEIEQVLSSAKLLHTDTVRLWAGVKGSSEYTAEERDDLIREAVFLSESARKEGIRLCLECHPHTLTDEKDAAESFLQAVNRENLKMYWQPNQYKSAADNQRYLEAVLPHLANLHVFNWHGEEKQPLAMAAEEWKVYFALANRDQKTHYCLLEFIPDGKKESLLWEAETLNALLNGLT